VHPGVFVGTAEDCRSGETAWAVVHACKSPCHQHALGYSKNLPPTHPNYLVFERGADLFLNIIDPPVPLFQPPLFVETLRFSHAHAAAGRQLLFHCNQGQSRAPSLAMLHLAKNLRLLDATSYGAAASEFVQLYPSYMPGRGIQVYLEQHWNEF